MWQLITAALLWLIKGATVKVAVIAAIFSAVAFLWPILLSWVVRFADISAITSSISFVPEGVWWIAHLFRVDIGMQSMVAAYATRFLIRRLPVIG